jgi:hypothetical protein
MNYWLAQLILAARKSSDDNGWVQILVFVVLAIFWALGSILKAKANKGAARKKQTPGKAVREPPESTIEIRLLKQLFGLSEEAESGSQSQPQVTKPQIAKPQVRPTVRKVTRPQPAVRKAPIKVPKIAPKIEKVTELAVAMPQVEAAAPAEIPQVKYLSEILSDYEDAEKLRRAILHYEILGKPISLREQERAF